MGGPSLQQVLHGSKYVGIEHFSKSGQDYAAAVVVSKKKGELTTRSDQIITPGQLPQEIDKTWPVYVVLNTSQIVQKEAASVDLSDNKLLHKAFPNLDHDEFYFEIWRLDSHSIVAVGRRSYVDEIISNYNKEGYSVAGISLGVCSCMNIVPYMDVNEWATNSQLVTIYNERIISILPDDSNRVSSINGLDITNRSLLGFSRVLGEVTGSQVNSGNVSDFNAELKDRYQQKQFFSVGFKSAVVFLLAILLINFFVFTHYFKKAEEISASLMVGQSTIESVAKTKERVKLKEEKVKQVAGMTSGSVSVILNDITRNVPSSVLLNEITYNPSKGKAKENEMLEFESGTIILSGKTIDNTAFTSWMDHLEKLPMKDQLVITSFGKNDLGETAFSVRLKLKG